MDFLGYVVGEMFLNIFGLRNPNAVLPDFWIYFGSLLCPLFNEHGFIRTFTERQRAAVYAKQKAAKELRQAQAAEAAEAVQLQAEMSGSGEEGGWAVVQRY